MVASLAHQIRTPLSAAMLYASHLADPEQALACDTRLRFAGNLKERLHELEHQVRDMLVFARGELPLNDRVSPKGLFQALQQAAHSHVQGHAVRWQCDTHLGELLCNRDTLVGALLNLIENAVQAGGESARLKIHLLRRENAVHLCVSDAGSGIDSQLLARLGEPFLTTKSTGTGLGVAVVQAVVRAHRGTLRLRSRLLAQLRRHHPHLPVLLMTAHAAVERAVEAMRQGAVDYLVKPFEPKALLDLVARHAVGGGAVGDEAGPVACEPASRQLLELAVERVGGRKPVVLDIRVLATTNRDLAEEVAAGRFREDLYYRLSVFPMAWRALRDRPADIVPLAERLLARHVSKMHHAQRGRRKEAADRLGISPRTLRYKLAQMRDAGFDVEASLFG
ncbi:hypothetical protein WR25_13313 [Diploscapter pachys]|uniref:Histidine kinase n=1 Tax=Diploscapter pachys TaxID=2018661 RepID=A0A2A2KIY4_9BILA|nr:hypothetical protein WR25_13313 [Diploscapter pachys]